MRLLGILAVSWSVSIVRYRLKNIQLLFCDLTHEISVAFCSHPTHQQASLRGTRDGPVLQYRLQFYLSVQNHHFKRHIEGLQSLHCQPFLPVAIGYKWYDHSINEVFFHWLITAILRHNYTLAATTSLIRPRRRGEVGGDPIHVALDAGTPCLRVLCRKAEAGSPRGERRWWAPRCSSSPVVGKQINRSMLFSGKKDPLAPGFLFTPPTTVMFIPNIGLIISQLMNCSYGCYGYDIYYNTTQARYNYGLLFIVDSPQPCL